MHGISRGETWTDREAIGNLIKEICFDSSFIDPAAYDKHLILTARNLDARFAEIDENLWFVAFRRAASEYILNRDLVAVEARHSRVAETTPDTRQPALPSSHQPQAQPLVACSVASQKKQPGVVVASILSGTMAEGAPLKKMSFELSLPHIVSTWKDDSQNERAHVLVAMPSGISPSVKNVLIPVVNGSTLEIDIKWPSDMFDVDRIFGHVRFNQQYDKSHPKCIALQSVMDEIRGAKGTFQSKMRIGLPTSNYIFTDDTISGHSPVTFIEDFVMDDHGNLVAPKTTIFVLFDLMVKNVNNGLKYSKKAAFDDDLMVG